MTRKIDIVYLIGFMGSGKSYVGQQLAEAMGYDFQDLDSYFIENEQVSIANFFEVYGENAFRQKESQYLKQLIVQQPQHIVIATGGGTPCFADNMVFMNQTGITLYLKPSENLLFQRLISEREHRPLLQQYKDDDALRNFIAQKIEDRKKYYEMANFVINYDETNQSEIVNQIIKIL